MKRIVAAVSLVVFLVTACGTSNTSPNPSISSPQAAASSPQAAASSPQAAASSPQAAPSFGFAATTPWTPKLRFQTDAPEGLLYADGSLWVAEHHSGTMLRVDPGTGHVQASILGIGWQAQQPFTGAGLIWVPSTVSLVAIDPKTNKVVRRWAGSFSADGVFAGGRLWIGNGSDDLLELDPVSGKEITRVRSTSENAEDCLNVVTFGAGSIWWSVNDASTLVRVDPTTGTIEARIGNLDQPSVAFVGGDVWVIGYDGLARLLDTDTNSVSASVQYREGSGGCPAPLAVDRSTLWIVDAVTYNSFYAFDGPSRADTGHFDPGDTDIQDLIVANGSLWVDFFDSGYVARFDQPGL
jgi:streptogramin lyase